MKKKIISFSLAFAIIVNGSVNTYAMPVAIPFITGGAALAAAIAVACGFKTTEPNDFREIYNNFTPAERLKFASAAGKTALILTSDLVNTVNSNVKYFVNGSQAVTEQNKVRVIPKARLKVEEYRPSSFSAINTSSDALAISSFQNIGLGKEITGSVSSTIMNKQGFSYIPNLFDANLSSPVLMSGDEYLHSGITSHLRIGNYDYAIKLKMVINHATNQWNYYPVQNVYQLMKKLPNDSTYTPVGIEYQYRGYSTSMSSNVVNGTKMRLSINSNMQVCIQEYNENWPTTVTSVAYPSEVCNDVALYNEINTNRSIIKHEVDTNLLINKIIDSTKDYSAEDLTYGAGDIAPTNLTVIEPITKATSTTTPGGATGTIDLSEIKAQLSSLTAQNTQLLNIVNQNNTATASIASSLLNIEADTNTAINASTAAQSAAESANSSVNALSQTVTNLSTGISNFGDLLRSILDAILSIPSVILSIPTAILDGLKYLFIPNASVISTSYNNMFNNMRSKLGVVLQAFDVVQRVITQDFDIKKPSIKIKLDPPYGNGQVYDLVDFSIFDDYYNQFQMIASAFVWFVFFRKVIMNNPFGGSTK